MTRRVFELLTIASAAALSWAATPAGVEPSVETDNLYVGAIVCKDCHGPTQENDPFTVWSVSKHSRTFVQLGTGYVEMIDPDAKGFVPEGFGGSIVKEARRLGIDTNCLECHTTADNAPDHIKAETFHFEDGVQCEACHGPGGAHVEWMKQDNPMGIDRPQNSGMTISTIDECTETCHRVKQTHRPFMATNFDPQKAWQEIAHGSVGE